jgi:hypothetical protein
VGIPNRRWDEATRSTLESVFRRHILPAFGRNPLDGLNKLAMQAHLNSLAAAFSRSVVRKVRTQLAAVLEEGVDAQLLAHNPARKLATRKRRSPAAGSWRWRSMRRYLLNSTGALS